MNFLQPFLPLGGVSFFFSHVGSLESFSCIPVECIVRAEGDDGGTGDSLSGQPPVTFQRPGHGLSADTDTCESWVGWFLHLPINTPTHPQGQVLSFSLE